MLVKIKTWEAMEKEFGLDKDGDINCKLSLGKSIYEELPPDRIIEIDENGLRLEPYYFFSKDTIECAIYEANQQPIVKYNGRATIVFWPDGTKTVAKVSEDDTFDPVYGYLICHHEKNSGMNKKEAREFFDGLRKLVKVEVRVVENKEKVLFLDMNKKDQKHLISVGYKNREYYYRGDMAWVDDVDNEMEYYLAFRTKQTKGEVR